MADKQPAKDKSKDDASETARQRLAKLGRNDPCSCGSGKKYKKCHLLQDEAVAVVVDRPQPRDLIQSGWRLFEQRRPGAAEKEFRAALEIDPSLVEARVGVGMAKLSAGDTPAAQIELQAVLDAEAPTAEKLRAENVKNGFTRPEAQSYLRAAHALGCILYDDNKFDEAAAAFEKVYSIDEDQVGMEARLISAKSLMKLNRHQDAAKILESAEGSKIAGSRAKVGLALAAFLDNRLDDARAKLDQALEANQHYGKALLGKLKKHVDAMAGSQPGSVEEAQLYAQTYGDVWTEEAKKWLEGVLEPAG